MTRLLRVLGVMLASTLVACAGGVAPTLPPAATATPNSPTQPPVAATNTPIPTAVPTATPVPLNRSAADGGFYFLTFSAIPYPSQSASETIWIQLCGDDACAQPKAGIPVHTVWNYRTTTSTLDWQTGSDGKAAMIRNISDATCGYTVRVDIYVFPDQAQIDSAYFTPCGNAVNPSVPATNTPVPPPAVTSTPVPPPPPTATPTPPPIVFTSVQGARPFGTASVAIKGPPNTQCTIAYTTPAGTSSVAQGLVPKTTDGNGMTSWSWVIGSNTRPGTGRVAVTCGSVSKTTDIVISG